MLAKNMGQIDRTLRTAIGAVLLILAIVSLSGVWAWISGLVGVVLLVTAATGRCPPYALLGISTCKTRG